MMTPSSSMRAPWARMGRQLAVAVGAVAVWAVAGAARADNVYWSVGVNSPGVSVGVSNAPPVVVYPQPIYHPRPVVVYPQPVYHPRPVVVYPAAVHPGWGPPPHHWKKGHPHGKGHKHAGHRRDDDYRRHWR